jgi:uncharacterized repeat protein (TIGR03803 family)
MKPIKRNSLLPWLATALALGLAGPARTQTFTNLRSLSGAGDGASPYAGLILSGATLYGAASDGGSDGNGTVFAVGTDGSSFTNLHSFALGEGINPDGVLLLSGFTLYGTAGQGGSDGNGTIFAINTDGTSLRNLHNFSGGGDGANPYAGLVLSGDTLYGAAPQGGSEGNGAIFGVNTDGTAFRTLHSFTGGDDGAGPVGGLLLSGNTLYGTATGGGASGNGAVFAVNTDGASFANLYSFTGGDDGSSPNTGLVLSGNTLYGTAGGADGGVVFAINTDGTAFTNLHNFTGGVDGAGPNTVILSGNTLYGTASGGGAAGNGMVFAVNTDGSSFTNLHSFTANSSPGNTNSDGALPVAGLVLSGNTVYGTTVLGGSSGNGAVFAIILGNAASTPPAPIPLEIQSAGGAVVLSWTNSAFALQSAPGVTGPFTTLPGATSPHTIPAAGTPQFFRLISN